jgi:hypothetical protein
MGSAPTPPTPTDPNVVAQGQQTLNTNAAQASQQGSMVNQYNPYGSLQYTQTGTSASGTPIYSANESLSPTQNQLLNTLQGTQQTAGTQASNLLSGANYGAQSPGTAIGNATSGLTGAAVNQQVAYLQPYFSQQTSQLDTQLRNQGFAPGQPGYDNAMRGLENNQNNTVTGFISQIEPQMYQQATSSYELPLQMATTEAGFGAPANVNQNLTTTPGLSVQPADLTGATATAEQQQQASYQDQMQQYTAMMSGLMGIPTAILGGLATGGLGGIGGLSGLLGAGGLMSAGTAFGNIGNMPATGFGSPTDAQANAYSLSQGVNPY